MGERKMKKEWDRTLVNEIHHMRSRKRKSGKHSRNKRRTRRLGYQASLVEKTPLETGEHETA